jgi:Trk K+ transport system NAD-binding subunit
MERDLGIVIGFGPAGRAAAERIAELGGSIVVIDQNSTSAVDARRLGYRAVTGDATHLEVLEHAGLARAAFVVVTVPGAVPALQLVRSVRLRAPEALLLVRARFHRSLPDLLAAGAHVVVDEEHEVGRRVAEAYEDLLQTTGQQDSPDAG